MRNTIRKLASRVPAIRRLLAERAELRMEVARQQQALPELQRWQGFVPPGHFYSPVPDWEDIRRRESLIFRPPPAAVAGLDLHEQDQLRLLESFIPYYADLCFTAQPQDGLRYHYENPAYSYSDAILLHCMIRHLQPARIIEIGSGYSSCMTLDTNELFFDNAIATTFIEPYPELLQSLLKPEDAERVRLIPMPAQNVDLAEFDALQANDILFIDSTHVCKIGSDVNRIVFDILPRLASGVHVHFHDIFYPFEYPREWVFEGRAWNEAYLLKAFLQYNKAFRIVLMNTYMEHFHAQFFHDKLPLCMKNPGGSIWLRKE